MTATTPLIMSEIFDSLRTLGQAEFRIAAVRMFNEIGHDAAAAAVLRIHPDDWLTPDEIKSRQELIAKGDEF